MPRSFSDEDEEQAKDGYLKRELKANKLSQKMTEYFNDEDKRNAASQTYPTEKRAHTSNLGPSWGQVGAK